MLVCAASPSDPCSPSCRPSFLIKPKWYFETQVSENHFSLTLLTGLHRRWTFSQDIFDKVDLPEDSYFVGLDLGLQAGRWPSTIPLLNDLVLRIALATWKPIFDMTLP